MAKIDTQFMTKMAEKPYPWGCTYLYSPYKGVPPWDIKLINIDISLSQMNIVI